jgi:hypothetical protein
MAASLLRTYETFDTAAAARAALLAAGFDAASVRFTIMEDEAGPVEGNFLIGNGQTVHGGRPKGVLGGPEVPYEPNFAKPVSRGTHLLAIDIAGEAQRLRALSVLEPFGGLDVDAATSTERQP